MFQNFYCQHKHKNCIYNFVQRARVQRLSDMLIYNEYVKIYLEDVVTSSLAVHGISNNITIVPLLQPRANNRSIMCY